MKLDPDKLARLATLEEVEKFVFSEAEIAEIRTAAELRSEERWISHLKILVELSIQSQAKFEYLRLMPDLEDVADLWLEGIPKAMAEINVLVDQNPELAKLAFEKVLPKEAVNRARAQVWESMTFPQGEIFMQKAIERALTSEEVWLKLIERLDAPADSLYSELTPRLKAPRPLT